MGTIRFPKRISPATSLMPFSGKREHKDSEVEASAFRKYIASGIRLSWPLFAAHLRNRVWARKGRHATGRLRACRWEHVRSVRVRRRAAFSLRASAAWSAYSGGGVKAGGALVQRKRTCRWLSCPCARLVSPSWMVSGSLKKMTCGLNVSRVRRISSRVNA